MRRFDNGLYIPRPSTEAYDLGLELAQNERVPAQFSYLYRNGVHALAAAVGDLGRVRYITEAVARPRFSDVQSYRRTHGRDAEDLRYVGEGLLALTWDRHDVAGSLIELAPGLLMSPINVDSGITVRLETSSAYTEMTVTEGVRHERELAGGLIEAFVIGHEIYVDKPQEPGESNEESRVRLITMGARKYSDGSHEVFAPMSPHIQPNLLTSAVEHMDNTLWEAGELLIRLSSDL